MELEALSAPILQAAVFLDRDKTLIEDPGYIDDPRKVRLLPGVADALRVLRKAGYRLIIATNQSGVARGRVTDEALSAIHDRLRELLRAEGADVDAIYYCPFLDGPEAVVERYRRASDLRKPAPGMLHQAAREMNLDLAASWMIGDSDRDIEAGRAAGCRTILLAPSPGESNASICRPDFTAADLAEASRIVIREGAVGSDN